MAQTALCKSTYTNVRIQHTEPAPGLVAVQPFAQPAHHPRGNLLAPKLRRREDTGDAVAPFHAEPAVPRLDGHRLLQRLDRRIYDDVVVVVARGRRRGRK